MPLGFGKNAITCRGRLLSVMAHLKKRIVEVKAEENCLAHALVIAIATMDKDPTYKAYTQGRKIRPLVQNLLESTGIDLSNSAWILELVRLKEHFREYKVVVYNDLSSDNIMFEGQVDSAKRLNILHDDVDRHYHVIAKRPGATARMYLCKSFPQIVYK